MYNALASWGAMMMECTWLSASVFGVGGLPVAPDDPHPASTVRTGSNRKVLERMVFSFFVSASRRSHHAFQGESYRSMDMCLRAAVSRYTSLRPRWGRSQTPRSWP